MKWQDRLSKLLIESSEVPLNKIPEDKTLFSAREFLSKDSLEAICAKITKNGSYVNGQLKIQGEYDSPKEIFYASKYGDSKDDKKRFKERIGKLAKTHKIMGQFLKALRKA